MKPFLIIFCSLFFFLNNSFARVTATLNGEYRTVQSGDWNDLNTWQVKSSTNLWATPTTLPDSTVSVYIQYGHTVTISNMDASCFNLNISDSLLTPTTYQLILNNLYNLKIYGSIRAFVASPFYYSTYTATNVDGTTEGATNGSSITLKDLISTSSTGVLKFVGGTVGVPRNFAIANNDWNSGGTTCKVEFALNPGAIITNNSGFKFKRIVLSSGQLTSTSFISAGQAAGDSFIIRNGAYLLSSRSGASSQVIAFSSGSSNPCNNITIERGGTLELTGVTPYIDTKTFNNNGTVIYSYATSAPAQQLLQPSTAGTVLGSTYISNYCVLILRGGVSSSAAYSKTIPKCININFLVDSTINISDTLRLNGNKLTYFSNQGKIVYGPNATLVFDPSAALNLPVTSIEWPAVGAPKKILFQKFTCGILANSSLFGAGDRTITDTLEFVTGSLQINNNNALYLDSGSSINIKGTGFVTYTSANANAGTLIYSIGSPLRGAGQKVNLNINVPGQITPESTKDWTHNYGRINLNIAAGSRYRVGARTVNNFINNGILELYKIAGTGGTFTIKGDISGNGYIFSDRTQNSDSSMMSIMIDSSTTSNTIQYLNFYPNQDLFFNYGTRIDTNQLKTLTINRYGTEYILNAPVKIFRGLSLRNGILNDNGNVISVGAFIGKDSSNAPGTHLAYHKTNNSSPGKIKLLGNYIDPTYVYLDSVRLANLDILNKVTVTGNATIDKNLNIYADNINGSSSNSVTVTGITNIYNSCVLNTGLNALDTINLNANVTLNAPMNVYKKLNYTNSGNTLTTNDNLTLKSTASYTSYVGQLNNGNTITGKVTVERYMQAKKAWRLLHSPTQHDNQTIKGSWMENGTTPAGFGTWVTSSQTNFTDSGFDAQTNSNSILTFDPTTQLWNGITGTNQNFDNVKAYMTYVRGDRLVTTLNANANTTTLREKGSLNIGNVAYDLGTGNAGDFISTGNPYAAPISLSGVTLNNLDNTFYVWDPTLAGSNSVGAYQSMLLTGGFVNIVPTPSGSYLNGNVNIESGSGFFVKRSAAGATSITFHESDKQDGSNLVTRAVANPYTSIRADLYKNSNNENVIVDGVMNMYDNSFTSDIDKNDAKKLYNSKDNLSINSSNQPLAIETRKEINVTDTVYYELKKMSAANYQLVFTPENFDQNNIQPVLEDAYVHSKTNISSTQKSVIDFVVNSDEASYASNRFMLTFKPLNPLPIQSVQLNAKKLNATVELSWNTISNVEVKNYAVEKSENGKDFNQQSLLQFGNSWIDNHLNSGNNFYRIKATDATGKQTYSNVVNVLNKTNSTFTIQPNNIKIGNQIHLVWNENVAGNYQLQLIDATGKMINKTTIKITKENKFFDWKLPSTLATGMFNLKLADESQNDAQQLIIY
jgi:hypothetical protein